MADQVFFRGGVTDVTNTYLCNKGHNNDSSEDHERKVFLRLFGGPEFDFLVAISVVLSSLSLSSSSPSIDMGFTNRKKLQNEIIMRKYNDFDLKEHSTFLEIGSF